MTNLPVQQARQLFHKAQIATYKEIPFVPSFFRSFFNVTTTAAKTVGVQVQRGSERIAVDVQRGAGGNRNKWSLSTEKEYMPPFYNEEFEGTQFDRYDYVFGAQAQPTPATIGYLARDIAEKYADLRNKIERAKEKMCSQVFETGIVELTNHDNIDFKRKADSKVDNTSDPWSNADADVEGQLVAAGDFIRTKGKNNAKELNLVMSSDAYIALKGTNYFQNNANFERVQLIDVNFPQVDAGGGSFHGRIAAGSYIFYLWTYDEMYQDKNGDYQYYWPRKQAFVVPTRGTQFVLAHAGVPAIIRDTGNAEFNQFIVNQESEYYLNNYIDERGKSHTFEIYSAPLTVPVTVDMIYTMEILT